MTASAIPRNPVLDPQSLRFGGTPDRSILDRRHCLFTSSGRAAIAVGLRNLGIARGDAVLVPTFHCPTMVAPVVELGATPLFYPITKSGAVDIPRLDAIVTARTKAIIAAHYFGLPQPMQSLRTYCDQRNIALLEDCAHAFFGESEGRPVGSWGDVAIASLTKFFCTPSGGVLVSDRLPLDRVFLARNSVRVELKAVMDVLETACRTGRLGVPGRLLDLAFALKQRLRAGGALVSSTTGPSENAPASNAFEFDIAAALRRPESICRWIAMHSDYRTIIDRRRHIFQRLARELAGRPGFFPLKAEIGPHDAPYVFPIWVDEPDKKYLALRQAQIPVFRWDWLWPDTTRTPGDPGIEWSSKVVQIACHQSLSDEDVSRIVAGVVGICRSDGPC
jgi:perosamine synthetase